MGDERASATRQREAGIICCRCHILLPPPPLDHSPGPLTGERVCAKCDPRQHPIRYHLMQKDWSLTFTDTDGKTRIGPWLLCDSYDEVMKILRWGNVQGPDLDQHERTLKAWGVASGTLHLTSRQRHQLIVRGKGWPWNGYELKKMKDAGKYPPKLLGPAQEAEYHRRAAAETARRHHRR